KADQPARVQFKTERIERKRQPAADALDVRLLERPQREERRPALVVGERPQMLRFGRREVTLGEAEEIDATLAFFHINANIARTADRQRDGAAAVREVEVQRTGPSEDRFAKRIGRELRVAAVATEVGCEDAAHQASRQQKQRAIARVSETFHAAMFLLR